MKKHLIYSVLLLAVALVGCRGGSERPEENAQVDSFYKSAYDDGTAVQEQSSKHSEGKEYKSTGDASLLDVKLPERLDNQTVHYKSIVVYFNKYYRVPNCVAYELTNTMTSMAETAPTINLSATTT